MGSSAAAFRKGTEPPPLLPHFADVPGTFSLRPAVLDPARGGDGHAQFGHHDASSLREAPTELVPFSAVLQGSSSLLSILKKTLGADPAYQRYHHDALNLLDRLPAPDT